MNKKNDIQLIEDYIDGLLKDNELIATETRLKSDRQFRKKLEQRKKLADLWVTADQYEKTKHQIKDIINNDQKSLQIFFRNNYYLFGIAASLVLLFGVYWFFGRKKSESQLNRSGQLATKTNAVIFKKDKLKKYGNIKYYSQLIAPVNNKCIYYDDTLIFRWKMSKQEGIIKFVILNANDSNIIFQKELSSSDSVLKIQPGKLIPGFYLWYINNHLNYSTFTIERTK